MAYEEISRGLKQTSSLFMQAATQARREEREEQRVSDMDDEIYGRDLMLELQEDLEITIREAQAFGSQLTSDTLFDVKSNLANRAPRLEYESRLSGIKNPDKQRQYKEMIGMAYAATDRALEDQYRKAVPFRMHESQLEALQDTVDSLETNPGQLSGVLESVKRGIGSLGDQIVFEDDLFTKEQFVVARPWSGEGSLGSKESAEAYFIGSAIQTAVDAYSSREEFETANGLISKNKALIIDKLGNEGYLKLKSHVATRKGQVRSFRMELDTERYAEVERNFTTLASNSGSAALHSAINENPGDWNLITPDKRAQLYQEAEAVDAYQSRYDYFQNAGAPLHMGDSERGWFERTQSGSTQLAFDRRMNSVRERIQSLPPEEQQAAYAQAAGEAAFSALYHLESMTTATPVSDWEYLATGLTDGHFQFSSRPQRVEFANRVLAIKARDSHVLKDGGDELLNTKLALFSEGFTAGEVDELIASGASVDEAQRKINQRTAAEYFVPKKNEAGFEEFGADRALRKVIDPQVSATLFGSETLGEFFKEAWWGGPLFSVAEAVGLAEDPHVSIPLSLRGAQNGHTQKLVAAGIDPHVAQTMAAQNLFKPGGGFAVSTEGDKPRVVQNAAWSSLPGVQEELVKGVILNNLAGMSPELEDMLFDDGWIWSATPEEAWSGITVTLPPVPSSDPAMIRFRVTKGSSSLIDMGTWLFTDIEIPRNQFYKEDGEPYGSWREMREAEGIKVHPRMLDTRMTPYDEQLEEDRLTNRAMARIKQIHEEGPGEYPITPKMIPRWQIAGGEDPGPMPTELTTEERESIARETVSSISENLKDRTQEILEFTLRHELEMRQNKWRQETELVPEPGATTVDRQINHHIKVRLQDTWAGIKNAEDTFAQPALFPDEDDPNYDDLLLDWVLEQEIRESGMWERYFGSDIEAAKRLVKWEDAHNYVNSLRLVEE